MLGPDGLRVYAVYNDNREIVREFEAGEIKLGDEVIYRGQVCISRMRTALNIWSCS